MKVLGGLDNGLLVVECQSRQESMWQDQKGIADVHGSIMEDHRRIRRFPPMSTGKMMTAKMVSWHCGTTQALENGKRSRTDED